MESLGCSRDTGYWPLWFVGTRNLRSQSFFPSEIDDRGLMKLDHYGELPKWREKSFCCVIPASSVNIFLSYNKDSIQLMERYLKVDCNHLCVAGYAGMSSTPPQVKIPSTFSIGVCFLTE